MNLIKITITGKKGKTVNYSPQFQENENALSWESFRFYTPVGGAVDAQGFNYYDVPAGQVQIEREEIPKTLLIIVTQERGVEAMEIYQGAEATMEPVIIGLEGDIIATGRIPADVQEEILIQFKEVINGQ